MATTDHTTDQTSANANGLPGILADLTPLLGPMQAEQLAEFLRNISAPQLNQEPEKKETKGKQPEQQLPEQLGQLVQLGQLGHSWRRSPRLARTILPTLARMGRSSPEKEKTRHGIASASTRERGRGKGEEGR